jgi:hypothetical protein
VIAPVNHRLISCDKGGLELTKTLAKVEEARASKTQVDENILGGFLVCRNERVGEGLLGASQAWRYKMNLKKKTAKF